MTSFTSFLLDHKLKIQLCFIAAIFSSFFFWGHAVESTCIISFVIYSLFIAYHSRPIVPSSQFILLWFCIYSVMLISGLWAMDISFYLEKIRIKSTLIALPFCFLYIDRFSINQFSYLAKFLVLIITISLIYVLINFGFHTEEIIGNIKAGKPIPVPFRSHVRYAILVNFVFLISIYFADYYSRLNKKKLAINWIFISISLFIYILFLAVKIGVLFLFISCIIFIIYKFILAKKYIAGLLFLSLCFTSLLLLIHSFPTLNIKLDYFIYDLTMRQTSEADKYSDAGRLNSIYKGIEVVKAHPFLGVGEGNVVHYIDVADKYNARLPHNQFVIAWAQNGIVGFLLLCSLFIYTFAIGWHDRNWPLMTYITAMFLACSVEPMLETQLGVALFTLPIFVLYLLNFKTDS